MNASINTVRRIAFAELTVPVLKNKCSVWFVNAEGSCDSIQEVVSIIQPQQPWQPNGTRYGSIVARQHHNAYLNVRRPTLMKTDTEK